MLIPNYIIAVLANSFFLFLSLALVGNGNRLIWLFLGPITFTLVALFLYGIYLVLPSEPTIVRLMYTFIAYTIAPALDLFLTVQFKIWRTRKANSTFKRDA